MSFQDTLLQLFPVPSLVALRAAGIDIAETSAKCVVLSEHGAEFEVDSYAEITLGDGVVVAGDIEIRGKVVDVLRTFRLKHAVRYAHTSVPERKAYLYQTLIPKGNNDLRAGVEFDLPSHVPLAPAEVVFDFEVVRTVEAGTVVAVTAYAKRMVEKYVSVFEDAGIVLRSIEVESQAVARALLSKEDAKRTVMIIDLGKQVTRIAIVDGGVVSATTTLDIGGSMLTSVLMKTFSIPEADAEKMKSESGFLMKPENAEVKNALLTSVSVIKDEIVAQFNFWNNPAEATPPHPPVSKIILCGGGANLKGFAEYVSEFLHVPVTVGNTWTNAFSLNTYIPPVDFAESLKYATAVGLALRSGVKKSW